MELKTQKTLKTDNMKLWLLKGSLQFDIKKIIIAALLGLIAYIIKNFFTNSQDKFLKSEKNS